MPTPIIKYISAALAAGAIVISPAFADTMKYAADLTATAEVPPTESAAIGNADVTVDTDANTVSWIVTVEGLTGDPTAAHIHGPAAQDENAPPVIDMSEAIMEGSADISDKQIDELKNGKYYVNVHTKKYPNGEIRGQLAVIE